MGLDQTPAIPLPFFLMDRHRCSFVRYTEDRQFNGGVLPSHRIIRIQVMQNYERHERDIWNGKVIFGDMIFLFLCFENNKHYFKVDKGCLRTFCRREGLSVAPFSREIRSTFLEQNMKETRLQILT